VGKYYSGSTQIDIFDAAIFESEKAGAKNGRSNGNSKNGIKVGKNGNDRLSDADLGSFGIEDFTFNNDSTEDFELVEQNDEIDLAELAKASEDAPVVRLVNILMVDSLRRGASDIHVEPY